MKQETFSDIEYAHRKRKTRRDIFLETIDSLMPWDDWVRMIRPYYPSGRRGRPPRDIETMLRMYLLMHLYSLSAESLEDAVYDSYAMRSFMHLDFLKEQVPGASTMLRFRHLLKDHGISGRILQDVEEKLTGAGLKLSRGTLVDAAASPARSALSPGRKS